MEKPKNRARSFKIMMGELVGGVDAKFKWVISASMKTGVTLLAVLLAWPAFAVDVPTDGRKLGIIMNQDDSARLWRSPGKEITPQWHRDHLTLQLIKGTPGVYAQCVGFPDPVIYRSKVATLMSKYNRPPDDPRTDKSTVSASDPRRS